MPVSCDSGAYTGVCSKLNTPTRPATNKHTQRSEWGHRRINARHIEAARERAAVEAGRLAWSAAAPGNGTAAATAGVIGWHHYGSTWHSNKGPQFGLRMAGSAREAARFFSSPGSFVEWSCGAQEPPGGFGGRQRRRRVQEQQPDSAPGQQPPAAAANTTATSPPGPQEPPRTSIPVPPPAPMRSPAHEPPPFLCEEFVVDSVANRVCAAVVITGSSSSGSGGSGSGGSEAELQQAAAARFDPSALQRLRQRGCLIVHIGPEEHPPSSLSDGGTSNGQQPADDGGSAGAAAGRRRLLQGNQQQKQQQQPGELIHIRASLAPASAPLVSPPALALSEALLEAAAAAAPRLGLAPDLLHGEGARPRAGQLAPRFALVQLACGGCDWDALAGLAAEEARDGGGSSGGGGAPGSSRHLLDGVDALIVEAAARPPPDHRTASVYGLLYRRHGFLGYLHQPLGPAGLRLGWVRQPKRRAAVRAVVMA